MLKVFPLAVAFAFALTVEAGGAASQKRGKPSSERTGTSQIAQEQDEFRSCDVAVREFVHGRKEAAALLVKELKVDALRMTLNFVHPYGESGDTPPNLAFTRGESVEERRRALNEAKQRVRMLAEAAKTGNVWYVIALKKENDTPDERRTPSMAQSNEGPAAVASAVVLASIEGRCLTISQYEEIRLNSLSEDLRAALGQRGREASPTEDAPKAPPS